MIFNATLNTWITYINLAIVRVRRNILFDKISVTENWQFSISKLDNESSLKLKQRQFFLFMFLHRESSIYAAVIWLKYCRYSVKFYSINQSIDQSINQSINQSVNQSINQSINLQSTVLKTNNNSSKYSVMFKC